MVRGTIDDLLQQLGDPIVTVVDGYGPHVDKDVEAQVEHFVEWEQEGVDVVGEALEEAIHGVEGVAGKGSGDLPHVMGFMKMLQIRPEDEAETPTFYRTSGGKKKT